MKATSTFRFAFTDGWNLFFVISLSLCLLALLLAFVSGVFNITLLFLFFVILAFLILQFWGMLNIAIEVDNLGLSYRAAYRHIALLWDEIEAVRFEPFKKQITFWVMGKKVLIHEFGLNPNEYRLVKTAMLDEIKKRSIPIK